MDTGPNKLVLVFATTTTIGVFTQFVPKLSELASLDERESRGRIIGEWVAVGAATLIGAAASVATGDLTPLVATTVVALGLLVVYESAARYGG